MGFTPLVLHHSCISCIYTVRLCISYDEVRLFFLANDRQYYVARLPGSDPKMGKRVCGGGEVATVGWGLLGFYRFMTFC